VAHRVPALNLRRLLAIGLTYDNGTWQTRAAAVPSPARRECAVVRMPCGDGGVSKHSGDDVIAEPLVADCAQPDPLNSTTVSGPRTRNQALSAVTASAAALLP
jgi:hypothetical protein